MYNLLINFFQEIIYNWYVGISLNIKKVIEIKVKRKPRFSVEGVWTLEKHLIGQFEGYEYIDNMEQASLDKKREAFNIN